jgi:aspartate/tyrosine/aromatic aminotransferase
MKSGASIREVFTSPDEVGAFIRGLIIEVENAQKACEIKEQNASRRLDNLRHELHNHLHQAQQRLNFTLSDMP